MDFERYRSWGALVVALLLVSGCSSSGTKRAAELSSAPSIDPWEEAPLIPRTTAKEEWESKSKPLPPLPSTETPLLASTDDVQTPVVNFTDQEQEITAPEIRTKVQPMDAPPALELKAEAPDATMTEAWQNALRSSVPEAEPESEMDMGSGPAPLDEPTGFVPTTQIALDQVTAEGIQEVVNLHRGKAVLVNMWGIDCGPCVEELPHLDRMQQLYKDRGLQIVGVNSDVQARWGDVQAFVLKSGYSFDVYLKAPGPDAKFRSTIDPEYAADPFTLCFDKEGRKVATIADALTLEEWNQVILALLEGKPISITRPDVIRSYQ